MSFLKQFTVVIFCLNVMLCPSYASTKPVIINNLQWPPFFFSEAKNDKTGLGPEIINLCLNQSNYHFEYKTLPVKRTHMFMRTGDLDISVYSYKPERESMVYYGKEPIFTSTYVFASKKDKRLKINELKDVDKYVIGHLSGLSHTPELMNIIDKKGRQNEVFIGNNVEDMLKQMLATPQRFDVMPNSKETFLWNAKKLGITDQIKIHELIIAKKNYFITVSKFSKSIEKPLLLLEQLDNCIIDLKESGRYQIIAHQYGL